MPAEYKKYHAKILLFGEYSIMNGSDVLSIPFPKFSGQLILADSKTIRNGPAQISSQKLIEYLVFLDESKSGEYIKLEELYADICSFLYFDSTIPVGYGLGSSGALVASIFAAYGKKKYLQKNPSELIEIFANMESWFHGQSSGMDPLSSFVGAPLRINHKTSVEKVTLPDYQKEGLNVFLVDTGQTSETGPLVSLYKMKTRNENFLAKIENILNPLTDSCITNFLGKETDLFFNSVHRLSEFQYENFQEMIPEKFRELWIKGINTGEFCLKLCGSGGGGFLIGFTQDFVKAESLMAPSPYPLMKVI